MLEVAEALSIVLQRACPLRPTTHSLSPALVNHVLAADARADRDSPPFDKSLRDGYAVRAADCSASCELQIVEEIAAGVMPKLSIAPGECARIFTGAPIPKGADAVVMQEDIQAIGNRVRILDSSVKPGQWIFRRGTEMKASDVVLPANTRLNAAAIGLLATIGCANVPVIPWPRVGIIATGDEIVSVDADLGPGQIRNSNGSMLAAQTFAAGAVARDFGIAKDAETELNGVIEAALADSDVVLLAGGVSAGKFDLVPGILENLGVTAHFHKVRMKPGKPLLFGTKRDKLVFGLPGNPVSAFVCFELFVKPALRKLAGDSDPAPQAIPIPLAESMAEVNDRPTYRPGRIEGGSVRPLPWAGAPDLPGIVLAHAQ
jgi:molybdopterin molybdotransferase